MSPEQKAQILTDYLKHGNTRDAFRENRIYYRRYEAEINRDPQFHKDMQWVHKLIQARTRARQMLKGRRKNNKFDEDKFIELLEIHQNITDVCQIMNYWTQSYYKYKKTHPIFAEKVDELFSEIRADRAFAKRIKPLVPEHYWRPSKTGLTEYERTRRSL